MVELELGLLFYPVHTYVVYLHRRMEETSRVVRLDNHLPVPAKQMERVCVHVRLSSISI